jgi:hypothetical protein
MVKAEITVATCYGDAIIPVEVLGKGPRPGTAWVRALNGLAPFTKMSHGGPFQDSSAVVHIPSLRDVRIDQTEEGETVESVALPEAIEVEIPTPDRQLPADWFLESLYEDRTFTDQD